MSNIIIRNNVFIGGELGNVYGLGGYGIYDTEGGIDGLNVLHNVFTDIGQIGV